MSGLIDFYFACNDMLAYDVAICLNAWCFENDHSLQCHQGPRDAAGLRESASLTDAELDAMPLLARGAALRFLLTRLVDWLDVPPGALVRPKSPQEYLRKLRFHQKAKSVRISVSKRKSWSREFAGSRHLYRRRLLWKSGPGRLGRDSSLCRQ